MTEREFAKGMFATLELRCGIVEPISTRTEVSGSDNSVSSTTVTTFELGGEVTEFSGGTLPFRTGDEAFVAGRLASSGIFTAYAVALPRQGLLLDRYSVWLIAFGSIFTTVGLGVGIGAMPGALDWLPNVGPLLITTILSVAFTGSGLGVIWSALVARQAKLMVQKAIDRNQLRQT